MTQTGKHTPGPWRAFNDRVYGKTRSGAENWIAFCDSPYVQDANANARLIAAAPELLEALKAAKRYLAFQAPDNVWSLVADAIAKAEGR